ncbi:UNC93-like protein MFSD11 [Lycorma delicatula]|uniref:UNC93-like protein MFSD11 n=1 Tax=Lycorma delicatula TaxID=130591 RepID=UPI003F510E21
MMCLRYFNYQLQNVVFLGICFMVLFSADFTVTNMQKTLLSSISDEKPEFTVEGYTSLGLTYTTFALSLWFGPSLVAILGPRFGMSLAAFCYTLYILAFTLEEAWAIYTVVFIGGFAGGILWTAEGNYIVCNSSSETISQNVSIFWAFLQSSSLIGNLYTYYKFEGKTRIDGPTRRNVLYVLGGLAGVSVIMFLFLRPIRKLQLNSESAIQAKDGPIQAFKKTWSMFLSKNMLILSITFIYTGLQHAFIYAVYSPTLGFTGHFGSKSKQLVALSGMFISVGEITGGGLQIIFNGFLSKIKHKRSGVIVFGLLIEVISYSLIYINLPNNAVFKETTDISFIEPSEFIAISCSFLLGVGDSCLNTQNYSIIAVIYPDESAQSSALYKFMKSFFVAVGLYSSSHIGLRTQMSILTPLAFVAIAAFIIVDRKVVSRPISETNMTALEGRDFVKIYD